MNCRCLEALERAWKARTTEYANMAGQIVSVSGALTVEDVRAALASKDADEPYDLNKIRKRENAGPSADVPNTVPSQEGAGSAGGLAAKCGHLWHMSEAEHDRMRAWEKWGRTHAYGALHHWKEFAPAKIVDNAIAAMPKDAPESAGRQDVGGLLFQRAFVNEAELVRLRARSKWIEEHAKPALEKYKGSYVGRSVLGYEQYFADDALAALPQDAGETK